MIRAFTVLAAAAGIMACPQAASATTYTESSDLPGGADFDYTHPFPTMGTLDQGDNTLTGSLAGSCVINDCNPIGGGDTQDSIRLTVNFSDAIRTLDIFGTLTQGSGVSYSVGLGQTPSDQQYYFNLSAGQAYHFDVNFGPGEYVLSVYGAGSDEVQPYALDYSVHLGVDSASPAPEPVSWAMMLAGFGAIGGAMRSRKRNALAA